MRLYEVEQRAFEWQTKRKANEIGWFNNEIKMCETKLRRLLEKRRARPKRSRWPQHNSTKAIGETEMKWKVRWKQTNERKNKKVTREMERRSDLVVESSITNGSKVEKKTCENQI